MKTCNHCNKENTDDANFCLHCGGKIEEKNSQICKNCEKENTFDASFCQNCGTRLNDTDSIGVSRNDLHSKSELESKKKLFTQNPILFGGLMFLGGAILILFIFMLSGTAGIFNKDNTYKARKYISESGVAQADEETRIELKDGAGIVIPANSIDDQVSVIVERNPEKSKSLPPLGDDFMVLGDFYNFEVTEGEILGPVDIVLPFDETLIPEDPGILVYAYFDGEDWEFIPVVPEDNAVTVYTKDVGDPIILWRFQKHDDNLEGNWCDPSLAVFVSSATVKEGSHFRIWGKATRARGSLVDYLASGYLGTEINSHVGYAPVKIYFNNGENTTVNFQTDPEGNFEYLFSSDDIEGLKEGTNHVYVEVECGKFLTDNYTSFAKGYVDFEYTEKEVEEAEEETPIDSNEPEESEAKEVIPDGAVELPDFVGQQMDDAIEWLEENGFRYTWIDGESEYELGIVFDQQPASGQMLVPHRTTVVLKRTTDKIKTPTSTLTATYTATNTATNTPTSTPVPKKPTLYADKNYMCRAGPGKEYGHVADILKGTTHEIIAESSNGWTAIKINFAYTTREYCWIGGGQASGDLDSVEQVEVQPTAVPKPTKKYP